MEMREHKPAIVEETNLVAMPDTSNEQAAWRLMRSQAQELVKSGMLPTSVKTAEAAIAIMQTGREFGLQPMQSFRLIHIIEGKPTLSASFMASLVQRYCMQHGGYLRQIELSEQRCVVEYKRAEWPTAQTFSFSMEDAKRAGLTNKQNWQKYPREMLYNRALANACRMGWPELVAGVYDLDELTGPGGWTAQPDDYQAVNEAPAQDARDRANARYFAIVGSKGLTTDERKALQRIAYGVESAKELSRDQLVEMANMIEQKDIAQLREAIAIQYQLESEDAIDAEPPAPNDDPNSPIPDFLARITNATTQRELKEISAQMQDAGLAGDHQLKDAGVKRWNELEQMGRKQSLLEAQPMPDGEPGDNRYVN